MTESKFDKIQRFFFNALDRMGATYEIEEMGCQPDNFYLRMNIDGDIYELSEYCELEDEHDCKCQGKCSETSVPGKLSIEDIQTSIALSNKVQRESVRY